MKQKNIGRQVRIYLDVLDVVNGRLKIRAMAEGVPKKQLIENLIVEYLKTGGKRK